MLLENVGFDVDVAVDGVEAIELCVSNDYAMILMDLQLPRVDGIDATRRMRKLKLIQNYPDCGSDLQCIHRRHGAVQVHVQDFLINCWLLFMNRPLQTKIRKIEIKFKKPLWIKRFVYSSRASFSCAAIFFNCFLFYFRQKFFVFFQFHSHGFYTNTEFHIAKGIAGARLGNNTTL